MKPGSGDYYTGLAREDYYREGGEPPGHWWGRGAEHLGVSGAVTSGDLRRAFDGCHPTAEADLVRRTPSGRHHPGWDLTFSASKSVSTLWSNADEAVRRDIQTAHRGAVEAALSYLEDNAVVCRRGRGGTSYERGTGLIAALFEHGTSRAQDPQLHTHVLVMNAALREDGTTGTLVGAELFRHKMAAGALYRAALAHELQQRLGVGIRKTKDGFEIQGVPPKLIDEFSKRRAAIERALNAKGLEGARASARAALLTRRTKEHIPRAELFMKWREVGEAHGFRPDLCCHRRAAAPSRATDTSHVLASIASELTRAQSVFTEKDLVRRLAEHSPGSGRSAADIRKAVAQAILPGGALVCLGQSAAASYYTTAEVLEREQRMLSAVAAGKASTSCVLRRACVDKAALAVEERISARLSAEQNDALHHITTEPGTIKVVEGLAGTGKTALLTAARAAWESEGLRVIGASIAAKAARGLEAGAGIRSVTIEALLRCLGLIGQPGNSPFTESEIRLDSRTVVVVDEAGMVDTRRMALLIDAAARQGAKVVLVGDSKQLQPVETGGAFRAIGEVAGRVELRDIRRQSDLWARQAVFDLAAGNARRALAGFATRGLLSVTPDRDHAMRTLLEDWDKHGRTGLILAATRAEVRQLNAAAQQKATSASAKSVRIEGQCIRVGDRVLIERNARAWRIANGDLGSVFDIDGKKGTLTVHFDDGRVATLPPSFTSVSLGYAVTSHKAQGVTVDSAYVLLGGQMQDRELSYVQLSRARRETRLYADRQTAGDDLAELVRTMSRSREKALALTTREELRHAHTRGTQC